MTEMDGNFVVRVNKEKRRKASLILKTKGKNLTTHLREVVYKLANEYDKQQKNNS